MLIKVLGTLLLITGGRPCPRIIHGTLSSFEGEPNVLFPAII